MKRLDQIFQLQKICLNELEQSHKNLDQYELNLKVLTKNVEMNLQESNKFLTEYDSFITVITNVMEITRKFNLNMHFNNLKLSEMKDTFSNSHEKDKSQYISSLLKEPLTHLYPAEEYEVYSEMDEEFQYPKLNLNEFYEENVEICGKITYIKSLTNLSFYMFDKSSKYVDTVLELSKSLDMRQYNSMPVANEVFGCVLDKHIFRAVISSKKFYDLEVNEEIYPCYILDTGEVLPIKDDHIMYRLDNDVKNIPAQAVPCQLRTLNKNPFVQQQKIEEKLKALQHKNCCKLKIVAIENNTLHVEFVDKCDDTTKGIVLENINLENCSLNTAPLKTFQQQLCEEELEMLYEEPLNTSNAMKAVMGYDPQDDKRICRFYDPNIGGCFKGANCKLEHTLRQPDGWTKDVLPAESIIDNHHPITIYPTGNIINITPTYVAQLDRFYAQINYPPQPSTLLIWNDEDIPSWKRLKKPPNMFDLVLSRYIDELWYRAKIMSHDDDYKMFKVLYVDYGNFQIVHWRDLALIDMCMAQLPFQAVLCKLSGVKETSSLSADDRKSGKETLCDIILNKSMDVRVVSHHEDLIIEFVDNNEYHLPNILVEMGLLELS